LSAQESPAGPHISVVGLVFDSVANRPLIGALVQIVPTTDIKSARSSHTDARGRYRIDSIVPGEYFATFFHLAVDSLGVQAPVRRIRLGERDPEQVDFGLPGAARIIAALCPGVRSLDSAAVIVGDVRDADNAAPIADAEVSADWVDFIIEDKKFSVLPQRATTMSTSSGAFALCGLPGGGEVSTRAKSNTRMTGMVDLALAPQSIVRRDFTLGEGTTTVTVAGEAAEGQARIDTLLRGPSRLTGTVLNESGRPVGDAVVEVRRTGLPARTDASGRFDLAGLPVGTHVLEVRRIGFAPQNNVVQLAAASPTTVTVALEKPVRLLDAVRVTARTLYSRRQAEIEQRRRRGFGHYIMRDELERNVGGRVTDMLRRVPGVRIYPTSTGNLVAFRGPTTSGPCRPTVFLDGLRLGVEEDLDALTTVSSLEAIEVYTSETQAPVEYWSGGCGAIVLWTRLEPDYPKPPKAKKDKQEKQ
jgi:Carboxypeptidase regulatory-like domain/TonB-dependent Receptor Plug Domain